MDFRSVGFRNRRLVAWSFERILSFVRGPYWFPCCVAVFVVSLQAHLPYGHFRLLKFVARKVSLPCSSTKLLPPFLALASARLENESTSRDSERIDLRFFFFCCCLKIIIIRIIILRGRLVHHFERERIVN